MEFRWTGEVVPSVDAKYVAVCEYLARAYEGASLGTILDGVEVTFHFCPILMPDDMLEHFPARSKVDRKRSTFHCCPQLDFRVFKDGDFQAQISDCVAKILHEVENLRSIGLGDAHIELLRKIFSSIDSMACTGDRKN